MIQSGAKMSSDGVYRYWLFRRWGLGGPPLEIVMLNPSTADADVDDRTVLKCIGFAVRLGFNAISIRNLFALRSTDPKQLKTHPDPIGPHNDSYLRSLSGSRIVVAAWGTRGDFLGRAQEACEELLPTCGLKCLGTTKHNFPRHPLYVSYANHGSKTMLFDYNLGPAD